MTARQQTGRVSKHQVHEILKSTHIEKILDELSRRPLRQVLNSLFTLLYHGDPQIKWNTVTAMGMVTALLAKEDMEAARVIVRRLMWNLNDESGGIGWGSPEAMGEILANQETLADEYYQILISYSRENANFQENEIIQEGVLWGIGRLSQNRPDLVKNSISHLIPYLDSSNVALRGITAWIMGLVGMKEAGPKLEKLLQDEAEIQIYADRRVITHRIKDVAMEAIEKTRMLDTEGQILD